MEPESDIPEPQFEGWNAHGREQREMTPYITLSTKRDLREEFKEVPFDQIGTKHLDYTLGYLLSTKIIGYTDGGRVKILKLRMEKPPGEVSPEQFFLMISKVMDVRDGNGVRSSRPK